jgi:Ca2+-transporting ATPase
VCAVCNEARIECKAGVYKASGAPTEAALVVLAEKLGVPDALRQKQIVSARSADPENNPGGVQHWYYDK